MKQSPYAKKIRAALKNILSDSRAVSYHHAKITRALRSAFNQANTIDDVRVRASLIAVESLTHELAQCTDENQRWECLRQLRATVSQCRLLLRGIKK